jgi:hypothetical protein
MNDLESYQKGGLMHSNQQRNRWAPFAGLLETSSGIKSYTLAFPFALPLAIYLTWIAGRLTLGYWPRPSLDDPKSIGIWVRILHTTTTLILMFGLPVFAIMILALLCRAVRDKSRRSRLLLDLGLSTLFMVGAILFLRWDPLHVVEWFMD